MTLLYLHFWFADLLEVLKSKKIHLYLPIHLSEWLCPQDASSRLRLTGFMWTKFFDVNGYERRNPAKKVPFQQMT